MTWSTKAMNEAFPLRTSKHPVTRRVPRSRLARQHAMPRRRYSCSTRMTTSGCGHRLGAMRCRICSLVFSSAQRTWSRPLNGPRIPAPLVSSKTRWAVSKKSEKSGSLRTCQDRWYRGHTVSWCRQRQTVQRLMDGTAPWSTSSWRISPTDRRLNGGPRWGGSSQAIALAHATCLGGKTTGTTRLGLVIQGKPPRWTCAMSESVALPTQAECLSAALHDDSYEILHCRLIYTPCAQQAAHLVFNP